MTSDRKKPGVAFWATVGLVVLPLLYVASFGPACWFVGEGHLPVNALWRIYRPLAQIVTNQKRSIAGDALCEWASTCGGDVGILVLHLTVDPDCASQ